MENSLKGLILSAGVIITCIVVGLGFYISREAKNTSSNGTSQITSMNAEYQDVNKTMYDGIKVSGREVVNVIEKYTGELSDGTFVIEVYTGKMDKEAIVFDSKRTSVEDAVDSGSDTYINPDGSFLGKISSDENGVVTTLSFSQQ